MADKGITVHEAIRDIREDKDGRVRSEGNKGWPGLGEKGETREEVRYSEKRETYASITRGDRIENSNILRNETLIGDIQETIKQTIKSVIKETMTDLLTEFREFRNEIREIGGVVKKGIQEGLKEGMREFRIEIEEIVSSVRQMKKRTEGKMDKENILDWENRRRDIEVKNRKIGGEGEKKERPILIYLNYVRNN